MTDFVRHFTTSAPQQETLPPKCSHSTTIAAMAAVLTEHKGKKLREKELDRILTELELLTDEEAKRFLANEKRNATQKRLR